MVHINFYSQDQGVLQVTVLGPTRDLIYKHFHVKSRVIQCLCLHIDKCYSYKSINIFCTSLYIMVFTSNTKYFKRNNKTQGLLVTMFATKLNASEDKRHIFKWVPKTQSTNAIASIMKR